MDNLNDAYLDVLSTYSGSVDDRRKAYLMDYLNYTKDTTLNDLEWDVLQSLGYKNSLTDAWLDHIKSLGGMTLSDKGRLLSSTFYGSVAFSPSSLFAASEQGVWYDPSDLTTLFQDTAGTTPVTATGQTVGRMLDKSGRGNHATQATTASRPTYGVVPLGGRRNLLTFTEQFDNAAWGKTELTVSPNAAIAPDGTMTADKLIESNGAVSSSVGRRVSSGSVPSTVEYSSLSVYVEAAGRTQISLGSGTFGSISHAIGVDLTTNQLLGTVVNNSPGNMLVTFVSCETVVGNIKLIKVRIRNITAIGPALPYIGLVSGGTVNYTGDGTSGVYIWGAQLELGSTATAYQKVTTAFNVTEDGVQSLSYLSFDGVDDFMASSSITWLGPYAVWAGFLTKKVTGTQSIADADPSGGTRTPQFLRLANATPETINFSSSSIPFDTGPDVSINTNTVLSASCTATQIDVRRNAVSNGSSAVTGTLNTATRAVFIGKYFTGNIQYFFGEMYSVIIRGASTDATQISNTETYVAGKTGVTL
jgi:hypothetical protein